MAALTDSSAADRSAPTVPVALQCVLWLGAALTLISMIALGMVLFSYFTKSPSSELMYALTLFGMPTGFGLMFLYVVLSAIRRSRL